MTSESILVLNIFFYILAIIYLYRKGHHTYKNSIFLFALYFISGVFAYLYYVHPLTFKMTFFNELSLGALIYYAITNVIIIGPVIYFEKHRNAEKVKLVKESIVLNYMRVILSIQLLLYLFLLPIVYQVFTSGVMGDLRDDTVVGGALTNRLPSIVQMVLFYIIGLRTISTIIGFYAFIFVRSHRKLVVAYFISSILFTIVFSLVFVMRSYMFFQIQLCAFFLLFLWRYINSKKVKKVIITSGVFVGVIFISLIIVISNSRFGDLTTWLYYRYSGEMFVNFSGRLWEDGKGTMGGHVYFPLIDKICGTEYLKLTVQERWEVIEDKIGIDAHIFYGYNGGLIIEFGAIITMILFVVFSFFVLREFKKNKVISLPNMLILGFIAHFLITGTYLFILQGEWGNLEIVFFVIFYIFFSKYTSKRSVNI